MRPTEVTDQAVIEAGMALQAEGRTVTGYALRQKLGAGSGARLATTSPWRTSTCASTAAIPTRSWTWPTSRPP